MGYPRALRILVIEDEAENIEAYREVCTLLKDDGFDLEELCCAGGLNEARSQIQRKVPFHLVILDIKLPEVAGEEANLSQGSGLDLIEMLETREDYPVPAVLILTGQPARIQDFGGLLTRLKSCFYWGNIVTKGFDVTTPIREALEKSQEYVDFGFGLVDIEEEPRPPLTPREEDLIRRYGLHIGSFSGADLRWWSAERKDYGAGGTTPGWSKVLAGRFSVRGHDMMSHPYFLKLESKSNGDRSYAAAQKLSYIRPHVTVAAHHNSSGRSLLVTTPATNSERDPTGLRTYLRRPVLDVDKTLQRVADDIATDVAYGTVTTEPHRLTDLVWPHHLSQASTYDELWASFNGEAAYAPSAVLDTIRQDSAQPWIPWRSCLHGDLHMGNVALDDDESVVRAAVFDPGSMAAGPAGRDLATLEISLVLHQPFGQHGILNICKPLYDESDPKGEHLSLSSCGDAEINTTKLLARIRTHALAETRLEYYRLLLLDAALIQLGSLAHRLSGNKIERQQDAVELYRALATWQLGPQLQKR